MKLFLIFALFGATYCLAVPTCPEDEIKKCYSEPYDESKSEEEMLDRLCREINCLLQFPDKCLNDKGYFPRKGYMGIVNTLCVKGNPLRRKYLENTVCVAKATTSKSVFKECGMTYMSDREEFCKHIPSWMQCAVDYVTSACGQDAGIIFRIVSGPSLDIYDCLQ